MKGLSIGLATGGLMLMAATWGHAGEEVRKSDAPAAGPLRIHPQNPRYFTDGSGRAVYLTGSHTWSNLQDQGPKDPPKPFDYEKYLDFLREHNHNVIRLWAWEQARWAPWSDGKGRNPSDWFISPNPYARTGPGLALDGKPKFNLETWDDDVLRPAPHAGPPGGRAGDLRLGDAVPGLELGQELDGRHPLARPPIPPGEQRAGIQREQVETTTARPLTTRRSASGRPSTSAR